MCDQAAEVKKLRGKLDTEAAGRKLLMQKYNDLSTEVSKLRPRSDRLHDTEERSRFLQKAHDLMEISLREVKLKLSQTERDVKDREDKLLAAENILNEKDTMITGNRKNMRVMRQSLTQQNAQLMELSQSLLLMNEQEFHRVNCLIEVGVQCQPEVAEMDIQTEFIIPAVFFICLRLLLHLVS